MDAGAKNYYSPSGQTTSTYKPAGRHDFNPNALKNLKYMQNAIDLKVKGL